jgi:hypothetical protein
MYGTDHPGSTSGFLGGVPPGKQGESQLSPSREAASASQAASPNQAVSSDGGRVAELAILLGAAREHDLDTIARVDLGSRGHKHQSSHDLAVMAVELLLVAERRRPGAPLPGLPRDG